MVLVVFFYKTKYFNQTSCYFSVFCGNTNVFWSGHLQISSHAGKTVSVNISTTDSGLLSWSMGKPITLLTSLCVVLINE